MALRAARAAAPTRIKYQQRLDAAVDEMAKSVDYWLRAAYRVSPPTPIVAQDSAADVLQAAFDKLRARWLRKFDDLAPKIADWFVSSSRSSVDAVLKADLRKAGFTVRFQMSRGMRDAYTAIINENVGLIKSIAEQHLSGVQTALMQSVQNGRDLGYLTNELTERTGITKRRAARIARDQNNKATSVLQRARALENGWTEAIWMHSAGGKVPRHQHVAFSGRTFDLRTGHDFGDGAGPTWPGVEPGCRCVFRVKVPGFD